MSISATVTRWVRQLAVCLAVALCCGISAAQEHMLAHFYGVNDPTTWESLHKNADTIELLSPDWFTVDSQLQLQASVDGNVLDWARARKLRLMPLLTNFKFDGQIVHALLGNPAQQQTLIYRMVETCASRGFWGMQLDFENVAAADRDLFSRFAKELGRALHARKLVFSVALPAPLQLTHPDPAKPDSIEWRPADSAAGFDYHELGKIADLVTVMTYDENVTQPGPIAAMHWVQACVRAMLKNTSRKKLLLGVALYYRQWSRPTEQQASPYAVTEGPYQDAWQLAKQWNAQPNLDPVAQELSFSYTDGPRSNIVWFSDASTLRQRLELVKRYKLRGFSAWRLGQEDPAAWQTTFAERRRKR